MNLQKINGQKSAFEVIKQLNEQGKEFWFARDLQEILSYVQWRKFYVVIEKAQEACVNSGQRIQDHFAQVGKMVSIGSDAERTIDDFKLSRYACYLIVQNADPSKPIVALGQTYFAIQTRKQELIESADYEEKIKREKIKGKEKANQTHYEVGKKVRQTIGELGGTMPEYLPSSENIKSVQKKLKK